ncbi:hypothetical protein SAMN04488527_12913 [Aliiroseovarius crassostreae]|uniref:Uncharacterized protein n=1 Tax=Aliiroseovarius crassostreae TaxID=154981 RepID=A0A0P7IDG9_9RHOB|nr:hypothetical protein [Aliiroseovarius crassostreae]KPN62089.1 hypothetical protein AKJ29_07330 [Aliiroseovarius crassostreae]SFU89127.1 hypothetical protein SAMN04488527_12913 [Aliiroseovarius crassostreae]
MVEKKKLLQVRADEAFLNELDDLIDQVASLKTRADAVRYAVSIARRFGTPREADQITVRDHFFDYLWDARTEFLKGLRENVVLNPGERLADHQK